MIHKIVIISTQSRVRHHAPLTSNVKLWYAMRTPTNGDDVCAYEAFCADLLYYVPGVV